MSWLINFIKNGGTLKGAIREFFTMNGRMPRTSEMNKMLQAFGTKGDFRGWTPKVIEGGKPEPKIGLREFTKKEDVYEGMIDPKSDTGKKLADIRRGLKEKELQKAAEDVGLGSLRKSFTKKYPPHKVSNELGFRQKEYPAGVEPGSIAAKAIDEADAIQLAQSESRLKLKMERENREAAERIRKKKAEEDKLSIFTDERPPKDPEFASGGRAGFDTGGILSPQMADFINNYSDQMTFEQYLQMMSNKMASGGRIGYDQGGRSGVIGKIADLFFDEEGNYSKALQRAKFEFSKFVSGMGTDLETGAEWYNKLEPEEQRAIIEEKIKYRQRTDDVPVYDERYAGTRGIGGNYAQGGRIGYADGTSLAIKESLEAFKRYKDAGGKLSYEDFIASGKEGISRFFNQGGRAGFYFGGDVKPDLSDIGHGSDSLMSRTRLVSPNSMATTSTGLNYLLAEDNDNTRIPYSKGGIAKILEE